MADGWIPITNNNRRDLTAMDQARMCEIACHLWERNPVANRMIEIPVSYLAADSCTLKSGNEKTQEALDRMWHSPVNRMDESLEQMFRELSMFGEQCWPVFKHKVSGAVQVAYLDPMMIGMVHYDPNNIRQPIGIETTPDPSTLKPKKYKIYIHGEKELLTNRTRMLRNTFTDGDCLYLPVNKLAAGSRGRSDLLSSMDWIDALDGLMYGELDRAKTLRALVWHLQMEGADEEKVKARNFTTPPPNSTHTSNEKETLTAITPDFKAADGETTINLYRNHCLAAMSIPQHWYADAGDVNRATADAMAEPAFRALERRQRHAGQLLVQLGLYAAEAAGISVDFADPEDRITCEWPELIAKDAIAYTQAMVQIIPAVKAGVDSGMMTQAEGIALINAVAGSLGVTIDADGELASAEPEGKKPDSGNDETTEEEDENDD